MILQVEEKDSTRLCKSGPEGRRERGKKRKRSGELEGGRTAERVQESAVQYCIGIVECSAAQ
jgi:hypothetical protein